MKHAKGVDKVKDFLLELFFPSFCLGCKKEGTYLCQDCSSTLEILEYEYCLCNKDPLRLPAQSVVGKCNRCKNKKLAGLYCALSYKEKFLTRKLIYQFKYEPYIKDLAKVLANILLEHFIKAGKNTQEIWKNGFLVPVPLEKKKLKKRGYNQTQELASELSKVIKIPVLLNEVVKIKATQAQMKLSKEEREKNLIDAFTIKNPSEIKGKKIFLVDDVYTTGSTMEELARLLLKAGAKSVWGIAIAREG